MSEERSRAWDVIGWFGAAAAATVVPSAVGVYTGSFDVVAEFVVGHTAQAIHWTIAVFGIGVLTGLIIRHRIALRQLKDKDAVIAKLEADMERRVDEGIEEHMECFMDTLHKKVRAARDPDSVIRDRIASRELDPHSVRVLELTLKTETVERRWLRDALDRGSVDVAELDLKIHDVGHYFRDLAEERGEAVDPYGRPAARFALKPDVADVLAANREVFKVVEDDDAATEEFLRDYRERAARGEARKAEEGARQ